MDATPGGGEIKWDRNKAQQREWRGNCRFGRIGEEWRVLRFLAYKTDPKVSRHPVQKSPAGFCARVGKPAKPGMDHHYSNVYGEFKPAQPTKEPPFCNDHPFLYVDDSYDYVSSLQNTLPWMHLHTNKSALYFIIIIILTRCMLIFKKRRGRPLSLFYIRFPPAWLSSDFQLISAVSCCLSFCSHRGGWAKPSPWSISATTTCPPLGENSRRPGSCAHKHRNRLMGADTSDVNHTVAHKCIILAVTLKRNTWVHQL